MPRDTIEWGPAPPESETGGRLEPERAQEWIYVLVNSSMPGMVKVGRTARQPADRAAELSGATGVATPFVLAFEQEFADGVQAEELVHAELDRRRLRVAANREFFRGSPADIVRVVLHVASLCGDMNNVTAPPTAAELLAEADRHLFGMGNALQDYGEAVRCYRLAATRGSLVALERLGSIFLRLGGTSRAERRRAMQCLREGAKRGNYYCYCEMTWVYAAEGHLLNFAKAWDLFFARRADSFNQEAETGDNRYANALRHYISASLDLGVLPAHMPELQAAADGILREMVRALDGLRDAPEARHHMADVLRWAYQNLLPMTPLAPAEKSLRSWISKWANRPRGLTV